MLIRGELFQWISVRTQHARRKYLESHASITFNSLRRWAQLESYFLLSKESERNLLHRSTTRDHLYSANSVALAMICPMSDRAVSFHKPQANLAPSSPRQGEINDRDCFVYNPLRSLLPVDHPNLALVPLLVRLLRLALSAAGFAAVQIRTNRSKPNRDSTFGFFVGYFEVHLLLV